MFEYLTDSCAMILSIQQSLICSTKRFSLLPDNCICASNNYRFKVWREQGGGRERKKENKNSVNRAVVDVTRMRILQNYCDVANTSVLLITSVVSETFRGRHQ